MVCTVGSETCEQQGVSLDVMAAMVLAMTGVWETQRPLWSQRLCIQTYNRRDFHSPVEASLFFFFQ